MILAKKALVFGATGQCGSYLCENLVRKGYHVTGTLRYGRQVSSVRNLDNVSTEMNFIEADLTDTDGIEHAIRKTQPDEVYNFAALTYAPTSWEAAYHVQDVNGMGVVRILECLRRYRPQAKFFNAGSAEVFGGGGAPQNEFTPTNPKQPYGVSKLYAQHMVRVHRERYGLFACTGIMFNMESPRRRKGFFTSRVVDDVLALRQARDLNALNGSNCFYYGPLHSWRDWGLAWEHVEACRMMLQAPVAEDYVIGTGESHECIEFVKTALELQGFDPEEDFKKYFRIRSDVVPDVPQSLRLHADPRKIEIELGWKAKSKMKDVVRTMLADKFWR